MFRYWRKFHSTKQKQKPILFNDKTNRMLPNKIQKFTFILLTVLSPFILNAQTATAPVKSSTDNLLAIVMIIIAFVLAFVIWGMGQVLVTLIRQMLEKAKQSANTISSILVIGLLFTSLISKAQTATDTVVSETPMNYGGLDYNGFWMLSTVIIIEIVTILFLMFFINRVQQELLPQKVKKQLALRAWWTKMDKMIFTKAVAVDKEADILLDHDYDGIKELDNSLPPWWKYGFIFTIVVAVIYLMNFHVFGSGKNPTQEYQAEIEKANIEMANYASKNADQIDEQHLQMPQKGGLDAGKEIFTSVCWTCHGKLGEGGTGPNLTDSFWIHKGSLADVYASIKNGYPDKGMQSWAKNYTPKEINNLAGYIETLKGTHPPNPKAPQGELFIEDSITITNAVDTLKTK